MGGITGGGWRLVYNDDPNEILSASKAASQNGDFTSSLGLRVTHDGSIVDAIPGMPAFARRLSPYSKILAVNRRKFFLDELKRAIRQSNADPGAIESVVVSEGRRAERL
jgi:hypothetical protein